MRTAVLYARFSPRRKSEECDSIDVQLSYCRRYCQERGHVIAAEFQDANASGDDEERDGLWSAVESANRGGVFVAYKYDRIARSVFLDEYIRRELQRKNVSIEVVDGGREGDSPYDVMVRQIMAAVAEAEKKITAARTKAAVLMYQSQGRAMSKVPPYGKQEGPLNGRAQRTWIDNDEEQAVIPKILALHRSGLNTRAIARHLNDSGIPARGARWWHTTVAKVIERAGGGNGDLPKMAATESLLMSAGEVA